MRFVLAALLCLGLCAMAGGSAAAVQAPASHQHADALLRTAGAGGVLLDWKTGAVMASVSAERAAAPGSALKPLLLAYALDHGIVQAHTQVYCRRSLHVAGRALLCTHPDDEPMKDAEAALAASCNTWFAAMARRMSAEDLDTALRQAGVAHGGVRLQDADARALAVLGVEGISITPMQMAVAYRALLLRVTRDGVVWRGLRDSVAFGMANNARLKGVEVLGKTGTANNPGEWWSHGWFTGAVQDRYVLVVYVPRGDGGVAATLAANVLRGLLQEDAR